jgi:glycosyltransferase involved in cell wall biosynthesis
MGSARVSVALVAHDVGGVGGMERVLAELVEHGAGRFDVHIVSATLAEHLRDEVTWHRVSVPRRPFAARFLWFALAAGRVLRHLDVDVRHVTGALVIARADLSTVHFCHAGYVAEVGSVFPTGLPLHRRLNRGLSRLLALGFERWCYRPSRLTLAAAVSDRTAREMRRHFPGVPCEVTPNGVDLDRFRPDPAARAAVRQALGIGTDDPVVLFVGGEWDRKGLWTVVDAIGLLHDQGTTVRLLVAGRGDEPALAARARAAGVGDQVEALGVRTDVPALLAASDVFCLPSDYETYPLVSWEAAAVGVPQVVTRTGAVEELVESTGCGVLLDDGRDPAEVAIALGALVADPAARAAMGERAVRAVAGAGWAATSEVTFAIYDRLAGDDRRRPRPPA